jgi:aldose 1-epimerase
MGGFTMNKTLWGNADGEAVYTYELKKADLTAKVMNYGANLLELHVPDKDGNLSDVVLGYDKLEDYFVNDPGFGCCVTPVANRIGGAAFDLNGVHYELDQNDGKNNLHSGFHPFHRKIWNVIEEQDDEITFAYDGTDMECGFPGNIHIEITYKLWNNNSISITYRAKTDKDTIFNPTNHSYFNLNGHDSGSVMDHFVWLNADSITRANQESIPDGTITDVFDTPFDFRTEKRLNTDIDADYDQLVWAHGYDHNHILNLKDEAAEFSAEGYVSNAFPLTMKESDGFSVSHVGSLRSDKTGRKMDIYTDLPGIQMYSGNYLDSSHIGKGGKAYDFRGGIAFETQYYPNAINVPSFPQPVLKVGEEFKSRTVYHFSAK